MYLKLHISILTNDNSESTCKKVKFGSKRGRATLSLGTICSLQISPTSSPRSFYVEWNELNLHGWMRFCSGLFGYLYFSKFYVII